MIVTPRRASRWVTVHIAAVYGVSVGGLLLAEFWVAHTGPRVAFGEYQFVKQLVPVAALVALMGIDQAIPRELAGASRSDHMWASLVRFVRSRALLIGVIVGVACFYVFQLSAEASVSLAGAIVLYTHLQLRSSISRAVGEYRRAIFELHLYRAVLALWLVVSLSLLSTVVSASTLLRTAVAAALVVAAAVTSRNIKSATDPPRSADLSRTDLMRSGRLLAVCVVTLGAFDWIDQALVSQLGSFRASGNYVALKLVLSYPYVAVLSIIGFTALPEMARRRSSVTTGEIKRLVLAAGAGACAVTAGIAMLTVVVPNVLPSDAPVAVRVLLLTGGVMRLLLYVPSVVVGALGTQGELRAYATASALMLAVEAIAILVLGQELPLHEAAAAGVALSVAGRVAVGGVLVSRIASRRSHGTDLPSEVPVP